MSQIEEIKSKVAIEDLVGEYVQLKKAGKNFKGLCPWHQEKTPSFTVSVENQMCWCFGCNKGGDIFNFLEYTEGLDFRESLELLADKAGVKLDKTQIKKGESKNSTFEILEEIKNFYKENLKKNQEAISYLNSRGLEPFLLSDFDIGFAPENSNLLFSHLIKLGFQKEEIFKTGVLSPSDFGSNQVYDRFNGRIIFTIKNSLGKVIGFGGRIFKKDQKGAKYLNSPETPLFDKSSNLYALNLAKEEIKKEGFVVLTEGYMDTISCFKAGLKNVVASLGTAFNEKHVKVLKRYTESFYLCFDQDSAGLEAVKRAYQVLSSMDTTVKVIKISGGKDPDEAIKENKELFLESVKNPFLIVDYVFDSLEKMRDLSQVENKKKLEKDIFELNLDLKSNLEIQENLKILAKKLSISENLIFEDFSTFKKANKKVSKKINPTEEKEKLSTKKYLLGLALAYPEIFSELKENLIFTFFPEDQGKAIYKLLLEGYNLEAIKKELEESLFNEVFKLKLIAEEFNQKNSEEKIKIEFLSTIKRVNLENIQEEEKNLKMNLSRENLEKFQKLLTEKLKIQNSKF